MGGFRATFGVGMALENFFGVYSYILITFILLDWFLSFFIFSFLVVILSLFEPFWDISRVGVGSEKFFGVYPYRLITFIFVTFFYFLFCFVFGGSV